MKEPGERGTLTVTMSPLIAKLTALVDEAAALERRGLLGRSAMGLLNKRELRDMKLKPTDIETLAEVWLPGRSKPLYDAREVQGYIDSQKTRRTNI